MKPIWFSDCPLKRGNWLKKVHTLVSNTNIKQPIVSIFINIRNWGHKMRTDIKNNELDYGEEVTRKGYRLLTLHDEYNTWKIPEMMH